MTIRLIVYLSIQLYIFQPIRLIFCPSANLWDWLCLPINQTIRLSSNWLCVYLSSYELVRLILSKRISNDRQSKSKSIYQSIRLIVCLSTYRIIVYLLTYQTDCLSINQPVRLIVHLPTYQTDGLSIYQHIRLVVYLFSCLSANLSDWLSIFLSNRCIVYLSSSLAVNLSDWLSVYLFVYQTHWAVYLPIYRTDLPTYQTDCLSIYQPIRLTAWLSTNLSDWFSIYLDLDIVQGRIPVLVTSPRGGVALSPTVELSSVFEQITESVNLFQSLGFFTK